MAWENTGYKLVIDCQMENGETKRLYLDTCMDKSLKASVTLASQPLQNGKTMTDHMYSNPDEYGITGTFSLYGNIHDDYDDFYGVEKSTDRLTNIQNVFEYIMHNALICKLTTLDSDKDGNVRFKIRDNMVINNLSWKEKQSSMGYSIDFKEVYAIDIADEIPFDDPDLPMITMPSAKSLGTVVLADGDVDKVAQIVIRALAGNGYIKVTDLQWLSKATAEIKSQIPSEILLAIGVVCAWTLAGGILLGAGAVLGVFAAAGAATTIIPGAALIIGIGCAIGYLIWKKKKNDKAKKILNLVYNLSPYIYTNENGETVLKDGAWSDTSVQTNKTDIQKLLNIIADCRTTIMQLNEDCEVYSISNSPDDNDNREVIINIGGKPYFITFEKDSTAAYGWKFSVKKYNSIGEIIDLTLDSEAMIMNDQAVLVDLTNVSKEKDAFFTVGMNDYEVYIYNIALNPDVTQNISTEERNKLASQLYTYQVIVSKGKLKDHIEDLYSKINNKLTSLGYV